MGLGSEPPTNKHYPAMCTCTANSMAYSPTSHLPKRGNLRTELVPLNHKKRSDP